MRSILGHYQKPVPQIFPTQPFNPPRLHAARKTRPVHSLRVQAGCKRRRRKHTQRNGRMSPKIQLRNKAQNIARCVVRDGTAVAYLPINQKTGIETIHIQPMQYTTLLPEGITPGQKVKELMKGDIEKAVLMESEAGKNKHTTMDRDEFVLIRLFHEGDFTKDILGRETYGVSLLEPLTRTLKNHTDLTEGFSDNM